MNLDLVLGEAGVALADIGLRLYADADPLSVEPGVGLTPVGTGVDYVLSGLPEQAGVRYTATYEWPAGVGASASWVGPGDQTAQAPRVVLIPLRETGQAGNLDVVLLRDGEVADDVDLAVEEIGTPGDYAVSGWPTPAAGQRWTLRWQTEGVYFQRSWRKRAPVTAETAPVETIIRRLLGSLWLEAWLGEDLDERRLCPARVLGFVGEEVSWNVDEPADVYPWTPAEARTQAGFVLLRFRELDRFDDDITGGIDPTGGGGSDRFVSSEYRLYALDFEFALPSKLQWADAPSIIEARRAEAEAIFEGITLHPEGTLVLSIRNLARYPTRRRSGVDDGTWRRSYLTVQVRARVRKILVGLKEAPLP